jgi:hypothetical protein
MFANASMPRFYEIEKEVKKQCKGKYKNRRVSLVELEEILDQHFEWLRAYDKPLTDGLNDLRRANLCGADLSNIKGSDFNLRQADLSGADLSGVDLTSAKLA